MNTMTDIVLNDFTRETLREGYELFKNRFIDYPVTEHIDVATLQEQSDIIKEVIDFRIQKGIGTYRGKSCAEHPDNLIFMLLMTNYGWELNDINDMMKNHFVLEQQIDYGSMVLGDDMSMDEDVSGILCSCCHHTYKYINIVQTKSNLRILIGNECIKKNTILSNLNKEIYNRKHKNKQYCSFDGCNNFVSISKWKQKRLSSLPYAKYCKICCEDHFKEMICNASKIGGIPPPSKDLLFPPPQNPPSKLDSIIKVSTPPRDCEYCKTKFQPRQEWMKTCIDCYKEHSRNCKCCDNVFLPPYKNKHFATMCGKCYYKNKN
jgi:hypothetical protein